MIRSALALFGLAAILASAPAVAAVVPDASTSKEWPLCVDNKGNDFDLIISSCSTVIRLGAGTTDKVALAFRKRGEAHYSRGALHHQSPDLELAIEDFDQVLQLDPSDAKAIERRAEAYWFKGSAATEGSTGSYDRALIDYNRSIQDYTRLIQLKPDDEDAFGGRCMMRAMAGKDLDAAIADCDVALKSGPYQRSFWLLYRALIFLKLKQYNKAIADCNSALTDNSNTEMALSIRGEVLSLRGVAELRDGNLIAGYEDYSHGRKLNPQVAVIFTSFGLKR